MPSLYRAISLLARVGLAPTTDFHVPMFCILPTKQMEYFPHITGWKSVNTVPAVPLPLREEPVTIVQAPSTKKSSVRSALSELNLVLASISTQGFPHLVMRKHVA